MTNIIQNALDSIGETSGTKPEIRLVMTVNDGFVCLAISDNGPGFPDMDRAQLLEPYVTNREKGTGLGLAIVSKIVQDHAGELELLDADGGGACVVVRLPQYEPQEPAA